jgi:hypothetical protein
MSYFNFITLTATGAGFGAASFQTFPSVAGPTLRSPADLLGQGFDFTAKKEQSGPRTINAMRKEELAKDMDPDKLKVCTVLLQL